MPILVRTIELQSGMSLARALRLGEDLTLSADQVLSSAAVAMLSERRPDLYVSVSSPDLDATCIFENDTMEIAAAASICDVAAGALHLAHAALDGRARLRDSDYHVAERAIVQIDRFLRQHRILQVRISDRPPGTNIACTADAAKAVHLAMVLGGALCAHLLVARSRAVGNTQSKQPAVPNMAPLGLAALLRDISLWSARRVLDHTGPLTSGERELVYEHPARSAALLPGAADPATLSAVQHHHENHCGTGYPRGVSGGDIPVFARILRMADAFSAATSEAAYRPPKPTWLALWEMTCGPYAECYDPGIRKIFQAVVQPFPIGSKLRLACGRHAVVVRHGRIHGLLPEVVIAFDEADRPFPRGSIEGPFRLERCPELRVVSFRGEDLSRIYGSDPVYQDTHLAAPADFTQFAESAYP